MSGLWFVATGLTALTREPLAGQAVTTVPVSWVGVC